MRPGVLVAACAVLAGCAAGDTGRYVGEVVPRPNVPGARCGSATTGLLDLQGRDFTFAPNEGVLVIPGRLAADGTLHGVLALHGSATTPFTDVPVAGQAPARARPPTQDMVFDGRLDGKAISGLLTEPRCLAKVTLRRP